MHNPIVIDANPPARRPSLKRGITKLVALAALGTFMLGMLISGLLKHRQRRNEQ